MNAVCVILAAGRSSRMGAQKLLLPFEGTPLLGRAIAAAEGFPALAVVSPPLAAHVPSHVRTIVNAEPERGMAHSLALADATILDRQAALVVLLADTPLVDAALVRRVVAARADRDVAYPVRDGRGGHPVVFGPRVRAELAAAPEGDSLRRLRDDPRWSRAEIAVSSNAPFTDVDTPEDFARLAALVVEPGSAKAKS
ncbi:MAG: nucleotidyltransferase family protein [Candidatus Eremiobacteraeota bacterium]|nr:nucleotidyltransferase family protein [Candidatus Eremiobacteraeota bacterium]